MARKLRVQYPGAVYHVMNRGDHRERIFRSLKDRELFLATLGEACEKTDWQVHAWCLMSCAEYLKERSARRPWLRVDRLLGEHGIPKDSAAGREQFERRMELRRAAEDGEEFLPLLRGWCVGSEAFRKELLAQMHAGPEHYGEEIRESAEEKAQRLVGAELQKLGWREPDLEERRKGDPDKLRIALQLRQETTMTLGWIAERLHLGTKTYLSHLLYWQGREKKKKRCATARN